MTVLCLLTAQEHHDVRTVEFNKGPGDSLGVSIAGGVGSPLGDIPIFIAMMNPVGLAAQTQQLKVRDATRSHVTRPWDVVPVSDTFAEFCFPLRESEKRQDNNRGPL